MHKIFSYFVGDEPQRQAYTAWFTMHFPETEFRNEEALFFRYMSYSAKLNIPLKYEYFVVWMRLELRKILTNTKIHVTGTEKFNFSEATAFETALQTTQNVLSSMFESLAQTESPLGAFPLVASEFLVDRQAERMIEVFQSGYETLTQLGKAIDAIASVRENIELLSTIYDESILDELEDCDADPDGSAMEFVVDTGLPALDRSVGGIYKTELGSIEAGPGVGKTRFVLGVWVYRALTEYNRNVVFYALEQSKKEIHSMLIARHVLQLYGQVISSKMILTNTVPAELSAKVAAARLDLFESGKYGKLYVNATSMELETMLDKIRADDRLHGPFDMIVIDHMSLIESNNARLLSNDYIIVKYAYRRLKRFVRNRGKCALVINQLAKEGVTAANEDKDIIAGMAAGGMEVNRSTDFNFALSATQAMLAQNKRKLTNTKMRNAQVIPPIILGTHLACCYFRQEVND